MKRIILAILVISLAASCNKFLEVRPEGEYTGEQMLSDATGFEDALYGVYASMRKSSLYGDRLTHNDLDVLAQYFECFGNTYTTALNNYDYKFASVETTILDVWRNAYNNISNVNNVLANLENFSTSDFKYYNLYKGEALGIRAFMHFDLLRLYTENIQLNANASGIPYQTDFSLTPPSFSTAAQVYQKIIDDLEEAERLLADDAQYFTFPKVAVNSDKFIKDRELHFNLYAVQALLARVYLTKGDKVKAATYAEKVINSGKFKLMEKAQIGNGLNRGVLFPGEAIFGIYSSQYHSTVFTRFYQATTFYSYDLNTTLRNAYITTEGNDFRWDGWFRARPASGSTVKYFMTKLVDQYQVDNAEYARRADLIKGINLIRLPEMYYIAAEAYLESNHDKARDYFDMVIASRGITPLKNQTPQRSLTLEEITRDRYREFIGEGQTFFNMKRLNLPIVDVYQQTQPASNAIYVWPIPIEENDYRK